MLMSIVWTVFGCTVITIAIKWFRYRKALKAIINQMPGPDGHPVFGILLKFLVPPEQVWCTLRQYAAEYYPIYKYWQIGVPVVNLICPEDIEIVMSTTKHITKSIVYSVLRPWLGTGLLTSTGSKWQQRRKILTPSFHFNILQQFIPIFVEESELLIKELEQECKKADTNVVPFITQFTLNSICETAMGTRLNKADQTSRDYTNAIFRLGEILLYRLTRPWYHLDGPFVLSPRYREQNKILNILHTFSDSVIKKREMTFKETDLKTDEQGNFIKKKRLAMLDLLISAKNNAQTIDDEGIREEVDTFMFEGHDTTTASICFTLLMLACHEAIQDRVVNELQEIFGDADCSPSFQDLQNMNYLERVIKESLRMYPSVPFISRVAEEDIHTHSGYTIPADTILQIHIYDLHHNADLYPEPEKFDPDRFSPENINKRHPFAYIPFSAGPRNCIGQKFALLEIKTVISTILRKFVLTPVDTPSEITMIAHLVLKTKSGIKVRFQKRQK